VDDVPGPGKGHLLLLLMYYILCNSTLQCLWPRRNDAIHDDDDAKNANGSSLLLLHLQFASFDDSKN
jgi:hypothetical protein